MRSRTPGHGSFARSSALATALSWGGAAAPLGLEGCAMNPQPDPSSPAEDDPALGAQGRNPHLQGMTVDGSRCDTRGSRPQSIDTNHDGRADLVSLFDGPPPGVLRCKQADLNFDGRLDAYFHYDDGVLVREQFDQDFDGRIDVGSYYKDGTLMLDELDLNRDGFVDAWRRYDKGRLTRIETDRDADGRPDMFAYYLSGRIDRIGYDVSGDGTVDQWDHDAAQRARQAEQLRLKHTKKSTGQPTEYVESPSPTSEPDEGPNDAPAPAKPDKATAPPASNARPTPAAKPPVKQPLPPKPR